MEMEIERKAEGIKAEEQHKRCLLLLQGLITRQHLS